MEGLNPNRFLNRSPSSSLPSLFPNPFDHRKRYVRAQAYSNAIWSRWLKEYNPTSNCRTKCPTSQEGFLKTGALVWTVEPTRFRGYYPLTRIVKIHFGKNAVVTSAELKTSSKNLVCPLIKLTPSLSPD